MNESFDQALNEVLFRLKELRAAPTQRGFWWAMSNAVEAWGRMCIASRAVVIIETTSVGMVANGENKTIPDNLGEGGQKNERVEGVDVGGV